MSNKEIVFVSNFMGNGGAARVITILADCFANKGWKVTVCTFPFDGMEYKKNSSIEYIVLDRDSNGVKGKAQRISALRRELKKHPDAVIISFEYFMNMQTIVAAMGLRNKVIVSERNDPARKGGSFPNNMIRNILYRYCDTLVCQTPDAKAYFPNYIQKHTVIIPNIIKTDLPEPYKGIRSHRIVNFCRLEKQKNLNLLIDTFELFKRNHPDYTLEIYGDGSEKDSLCGYIKERGLTESVMLHPAVPDIHQRVLDAAMFVSSSDYEGISNSMLEAMAIGLPTICTDCPCGGAGMLIEDGVTGLLVPVGDKERLAEAMSRVADDDLLAGRLSANSVRIKDTLSEDKIISEWEKVVN